MSAQCWKAIFNQYSLFPPYISPIKTCSSNTAATNQTLRDVVVGHKRRWCFWSWGHWQRRPWWYVFDRGTIITHERSRVSCYLTVSTTGSYCTVTDLGREREKKGKGRITYLTILLCKAIHYEKFDQFPMNKHKVNNINACAWSGRGRGIRKN